MSKTPKAPNFSSEQEQMIRDAAPLNQAVSRELARQFGKTERSVTSKARSLGVEYNRKEPMTKSGDPVERKLAIVAEIASMVSGNLEGLDKAPKTALNALRSHLNG